MGNIPAPYRRIYDHSRSTGKESTVNCGFCGKIVPRWKTFVHYRGFRISDPVLRKQIDPNRISTYQTKMYVCPSCARYRGIIKIGRSRKSRVSR